MNQPRSSVLPTLLFVAGLAPLAGAAHAAVFTVTKIADSFDGACDSDCSLREAVAAANFRQGRDAVVLAPGVYRLTRAGAGEDQAATGDLDVRSGLTVIGAGADKTTVDGGGLDRVFDAHGADLELLGVEVRGGRVALLGGGIRAGANLGVYRTVVRGNAAIGEDGDGGGIFVFGNLVMHESTVAGNLAEGFAGGGMFTLADALINNSTVSGNQAPNGWGGGVFNDSIVQDPDLVVSNSTVTGNSAKFGGGLANFAGSEDLPSGGGFPTLPPGIGLRNSIVAGNTATAKEGGRDCLGTYVSDGYNLVGDGTGCALTAVATGNLVGTEKAPIDPLLLPLAYHGGPTPTHALLPGSPALDAGSPRPFAIGTSYCQDHDQRGQQRSIDGNADGEARCDIGAVEQSSTCLSGGGFLCLQRGRFQLTTAWTTPAGAEGPGRSHALSPDSGNFWFFDPGNVELTVKVIDACDLNDRFWVFASGLTNLEVQLQVLDTATGAVKTYDSPPDTVFAPILDTAAFACD